MTEPGTNLHAPPWTCQQGRVGCVACVLAVQALEWSGRHGMWTALFSACLLHEGSVHLQVEQLQHEQAALEHLLQYVESEDPASGASAVSCHAVPLSGSMCR